MRFEELLTEIFTGDYTYEEVTGEFMWATGFNQKFFLIEAPNSNKKFVMIFDFDEGEHTLAMVDFTVVVNPHDPMEDWLLGFTSRSGTGGDFLFAFGTAKKILEEMIRRFPNVVFAFQATNINLERMYEKMYQRYSNVPGVYSTIVEINNGSTVFAFSANEDLIIQLEREYEIR